MGRYEDYFRSIDFDKAWEEEDWEIFFEAQDRLSREVRPPSAPGRDRAVDPALTFRRVMRQFGMDPDDPGAAPTDPLAPLPPAAPRRFWEDGAEYESLPVYALARDFARGVARLCDGRFRRVLSRRYKSRPYRRFQFLLVHLQTHTFRVPRLIAAGHAVGYRPDRVKGNIVRSRQALVHADACVGALTRFPRGLFSQAEHKDLSRAALRLRNGLMAWIFLLRERFAGGSRRP